MGDVVDIHSRRNDGESQFVLCPCQPDGVSPLVVAMVTDKPFIAALVCPECESEIGVVNGYLET
ncbi:hypothetical protein [Kushneria sinocarnis]|uniref:hypothetical protein n=1 Tax=Kushneria sinocarnis TaxID=595502 RepID=UPI0011C3451E|nr:hypothetical protein [Kushneria sinocarnis]